MNPSDARALEPALEAIPIFPLAGVVLFPRAILPLHIFEPRYRAMVADALASHRCIVMALALDAADPPTIPRIACAGIILQHEMMPDGRSNILLHGVSRVLLDELPFAPPYRRARARVLADQATSHNASDVAALRAAATAFMTEARHRGSEIDLEVSQLADASVTADLYAHHLVVDAPARQRALETVDVGARVALVTGELLEQTARIARPGPRGIN